MMNQDIKTTESKQKQEYSTQNNAAQEGSGIYMSEEMQELLGYAGVGIIHLREKEIQIGRLTAGRSRSLAGGERMDYIQWREMAADLLAARDDRAVFLAYSDPDNLLAQLQINKEYSFNLHCYVGEDSESLFRFSYHRMNEGDGQVLFTLRNCSRDVERDALTGFYNRRGFVYYTSQILKKSREDEQFAVCFFNICNFNVFNEQYGVDIGDTILKHIARKISQSFLNPLLTARIQASDTFLCLVRRECIQEELFSGFCQEAYQIGRRMYTLYLRCGICIVDNKSEKVSGFCDRAKLASDRVQDALYKPYAVYSKDMKDDYIAQSDVTGGLNNALENGEFCVYYQPVVDAQTEKIASAEALIRWNNPVKGVMSPALFVPVLEQSGHILQLDMFVAETVKRFLEQRVNANKRIVPISVNLSRVDFTSESGIETILDHIRFMSGNSTGPRVEITESAYTSMAEGRSDILATMQSYGAKILLDDFGTGYSSFSTIRDYDFDIIKLDMGFVQKIGNEKVEHIICAIIQMAHAIGSKVIAEGVETDMQAAFLRENDCDFIQGFYYARPLPEEEFERMLDEEE